MARKVCLSGFAELSRDWANKQPEGTEIWGMNEGHAFLKPKPARWFQIHPKHWNERTRKKFNFPDDGFGRHVAHVEWLAKQTCPVYMQEVDERIPASVRYPLGRITRKYGRYLTSTIAYMLALLLDEHERYRWWKPWTRKWKVESVTIAGIEMGVGTEYMFQRPCAEYFLGRLIQAGVEVKFAPTGSALLSGLLYAVDYDAPIIEGELKPVKGAQNYDARNVPVVKVTEDAAD